MTASQNPFLDANPQRRERLQEFSAALATTTTTRRPDDDAKLQKARAVLSAIGGNELVIEAASIAGFFELMTKLVDATDRPVKTENVMRIASTVINVMAFFYKIYCQCRSLILG